MIRVTFLEHSGFLVELDTLTLLFDWWKGELPELSGKPLFCFVSHRHHDHFDPRIFSLDDGARPVTFLLAKDIRLSDHNRERWELSEETASRCRTLGGGEKLELPELTVETLPSTDEGVAFLVTAEGRTVYHAGDLNWWHWEGEDQAWNRNMEVDFKRDLEPLRGRRIDLAFAPLDPRLGAASTWGLRYLLETADIARLIPMHQWGEFSLTETFCRKNPALADSVIPAERPGQTFTF